MTVRILQGDAREVLATLPTGSVHCCVTSPPYWGLRDYGVDGQLGLEATPGEYVSRLVGVMREVRRALRDDGTLWLNLGDCYATGAGKVARCPGGGAQGARWRGDVDRIRDAKRGYRGERLANGRGDQPETRRQKVPLGPMTPPNRMPIPGIKPKDLVGIPWRAAFALQEDGWWLRSDVVWAKPNPMPESVADRPTKAHEYVFLLAKSGRYYFDQKAVREPVTCPEASTPLDASRAFSRRRDVALSPRQGAAKIVGSTPAGRNIRSVWTVATQPFPGAHFAVFPPKLIEPCVKAGCPSGGTVLDPFAGAGTTGLVADRLGRDAILIELNPNYCEMARRRIEEEAPLFTHVEGK